jgi:hypothetical protein
MYSFILLNFADKNYTIIETKALTMVYSLHNFICYLLDYMFIFYVHYMALVYSINKPHVCANELDGYCCF